jgi:phospholipid/cholesterol/gamma-HCH transport system substrate-binding protein
MGRGRILGGVVVIAAVAVIALVVALSGAGDYAVHARFVSASQIVKGNEVKVSGEAVGSVDDVALSADGRADVTLSISADGYFPLRRGTRAIIRETSLSGVANHYVDL